MITSNHNPHVKALKRLIQYKKARDQEGQFVLETPKVIHEYIRYKAQAIDQFYYGESTPPPPHYQGPSEQLSDSLIRSLSFLSNASGWLVVIKKNLPLSIESIQDFQSGVILDGVSTPSNVGSILRNIVAFEIGFVGYTTGTADLFHPESIRASTGLIPPYFHCDSEKFEYILSSGFTPYATISNNATLKNAYAKRPLFIFGSEGEGIQTPYLMPKKDNTIQAISIPISAKVDSLNVSVASGIFFHELRIQQKNQSSN